MLYVSLHNTYKYYYIIKMILHHINIIIRYYNDIILSKYAHIYNMSIYIYRFYFITIILDRICRYLIIF